MKSSLLLSCILGALLQGCATHVVRQADGTYVPATFVEANAPLVQRSLSVSVCPRGMREAGETSGYVDHEATLDTERGHDHNLRYNRYGRYGHNEYRESPVRVRQGVGGRKVFNCVPVQSEERK